MEGEVDHTDPPIGEPEDISEINMVHTENEDAADGTHSVEELSSFDLSDDDNPLRQKLKEMYLNTSSSQILDNINRDGISTTSSSSRNTSLNNGNIMGTPGSVYSVKTNTTRPSSRNTIIASCTSDRVDQRLDHSKALLIESNTNVTEEEEEDEEQESAPPTKRSSPRRLHRVINPDHSETDISYMSDSNNEMNPISLSKILDADQIHNNENDRISTGADITRLNKELINCKVQIQLQQEIIRNNLLNKFKEPISDELIGKLNSLSLNSSSEETKLKNKCEILNKDLNELQNINSVLIDQQDQKQSEYEQWSETVVDILSYLEGFADPNTSDISTERMTSNLGTMLHIISHKVREIVSQLKETGKSGMLEDENDQSVIKRTPFEISPNRDEANKGQVTEEDEREEVEQDISFSSTKTDSLTQLMNESIKQREKIQQMEQSLTEGNFKLEKQNEMIAAYKQTINEFVSLLQQTLNGYVNEFIGFHSDLLSHSNKIFEHESIDEVLLILRQLVVICDEYQKGGKLINFQEIRTLMSPVWQHNSTVATLLVDKYQDMVKQNNESRNSKPAKAFVDSAEVPKLKEEIRVSQNEITQLKSQLRIANQSAAAASFTEEEIVDERNSRTYKFRLETMIKKWKQSEEALAFERRANKLKVMELEDEIRSLKMRR